MIPDGNVDLCPGIRSIRNGNYVIYYTSVILN